MQRCIQRWAQAQVARCLCATEGVYDRPLVFSLSLGNPNLMLDTGSRRADRQLECDQRAAARRHQRIFCGAQIPARSRSRGAGVEHTPALRCSPAAGIDDAPWRMLARARQTKHTFGYA